MMKKYRLLALLMVMMSAQRPVLADKAAATQAADASAATTMPAAASSPESAVRSAVLKVFSAMHEGDRKTFLANCHTITPAQVKTAEAVVDLGIEAYRVNKIAMARWGQSGDGVVEQFGSEREFKRMIAAFSNSTVAIDGASARVEPNVGDNGDDDINSVYMKLVGGRWLMDFDKMIEEPDDTDVALPADTPFLTMLKKAKTAMTRLGADIEAGKYKTPQEAGENFQRAIEQQQRQPGAQSATTQSK